MDSHCYLIRYDSLPPFVSFTTPSAAGAAIPRFRVFALPVALPYRVARAPSPKSIYPLGAKDFDASGPHRPRTTRDATLRRDASNRPTTVM